jgi:hypothetical protein
VNPFFADTTQKIQQAQQQKISDVANGAASSSGDPTGLNKAVKWDDVMFPPHHVFNTTPCVTRPLTAAMIMNDEDEDNAKQINRFTFDSPSGTSAEMISNEFTLAADEKFQLGNSLQSSSSSSSSSSAIVNPVSATSLPLEVYCEAAKLCNMSRRDAVEYLSAVMASSSPSVPAGTAAATTVTATTTTPVSTYPATSMTLCDKYRPKLLSQYHCKINNIPGSIFNKQSSILHFHTWLSEWKVNNINNLTSTSAWNNSKTSSSSSSKHAFWFEDDEEEDEDVYSNTCLIHGPSGVGKSSSVYSCADELGFNVIEVIYIYTFMTICICFICVYLSVCVFVSDISVCLLMSNLNFAFHSLFVGVFLFILLIYVMDMTTTTTTI